VTGLSSIVSNFIKMGKAVVQIAAIKIAIDHLLDIGPPEFVVT
jgi:hypothetical protein